MIYSKIVLVIVILVIDAHVRGAETQDLEVSETKGGYGIGGDDEKRSGSGIGEQGNIGKGKGYQDIISAKVRRNSGIGLQSGEIGGYHYVGEHGGGGGDSRYKTGGRGVGYNDGRGSAGSNSGGKRSIEPIVGGKGINTSTGIKPQNTIRSVPPNGKNNGNGNRNVGPVTTVSNASGAGKFQNKSPTRTGSGPLNSAHGGHGKGNVGPVGTRINLQNNGARPQSSIAPHPSDRGINGNVKVTPIPFSSLISSTGSIRTNAGPVNSPQWNINTSNIGRIPSNNRPVSGQDGSSNGRRNVGPTLAVGAKITSGPNIAAKTKSNRPVIVPNGNRDVGKNVSSAVPAVAKNNNWTLGKEKTKSNNGSVSVINGNKTIPPTTSQRGNNSTGNESKTQGSSQTNNGKVTVEPVPGQKSKMEDNMKKSSSGPVKSENGNKTNTGKRNIGSIIGTKNNSSKITEVDAALIGSEKPINGNGRRNVGATIGDKQSNAAGYGGNGRRHIGSPIGGKNNTSSNGSVSSEIGSPKRNIGTIIGEKINNSTSDAGKTESGNGTLSIEKESVGNGKRNEGSAIAKTSRVLPGGGQNISLAVKNHTQPFADSHTRPHQDGSALQDVPLFDILSFR